MVHQACEAIAPWHSDPALPSICCSRLQQPDGTAFMQALLVPGEPDAEMRIELIGQAEPSDQTSQTWAHDRMTLHTGRKQRLRAKKSALGGPRVGDRSCGPVGWVGQRCVAKLRPSLVRGRSDATQSWAARPPHLRLLASAQGRTG